MTLLCILVYPSESDQQTTPLRYAIMFCKPDIILMLISRGANTGPIGIGYLMAWEAKRARREHISRTIQQQIDAAPPRMPTQIAGKNCSHCETQIVFAGDGAFCEICFLPFCNSCKDPAAACTACAEKQTQ